MQRPLLRYFPTVLYFCYAKPNRRVRPAVRAHRTIPNDVGSAAASSVQRMLLVSFQTVMQVVEQGQ